MDHDAFLAAIREQSERFLEAIAGAAPNAEVPSCPGWSATDLLWHLGEVQHFWARVAAGLPANEIPDPERPDDHASLRSLVARAGTELLSALSTHEPTQRCWTWHPSGGTLGWVARRQAHEALMHRVDAELVAGLDVRPPSAELALDGVDEVLMVFVHGVPEWGAFTTDGVTVKVECTNASAAWLLRLGKFTGTGPDTGTEHNLDAAEVERLPDADDVASGAVAAAVSAVVPDLTVRARAWDLDRWLWGRGEDDVEVVGPADLAERLRGLLIESTK
jgi:uncharacterized protein (TIGR03083 family)